MNFSDKILELQEKYPSDIILVKNGIFFVAIGRDALFLSEKLKLKCTCWKSEMCKVGFLVRSAENYIKTMKQLGISFRMYILNENKKEELIYNNEGNLENNYNKANKCNYCSLKRETDEDIIQRLRDLNIS